MTCPEGKIYIGRTSLDMRARLVRHDEKAKESKHKSKIALALARTNLTDWDIEVLETVTTRQEAALKETTYIDIFDTINTGYNTRRNGGSIGLIPLAERKRTCTESDYIAAKPNERIWRDWVVVSSAGVITPIKTIRLTAIDLGLARSTLNSLARDAKKRGIYRSYNGFYVRHKNTDPAMLDIKEPFRKTAEEIFSYGNIAIAKSMRAEGAIMKDIARYFNVAISTVFHMLTPTSYEDTSTHSGKIAYARRQYQITNLDTDEVFHVEHLKPWAIAAGLCYDSVLIASRGNKPYKDFFFERVA